MANASDKSNTYLWRVLLIDGQSADIWADIVRSTAMGIRFEVDNNLTLSLPADIVLMIERREASRAPFPVSDRDLVEMYRSTRRALPTGTLLPALSIVKPDAG